MNEPTTDNAIVSILPTAQETAIQAVNRQTAVYTAINTLINATFKQGLDYDTIPGTNNKPTLMLPGIEKVMGLLGLRESFVDIHAERQFNPDAPFFYYEVECILTHSQSGMEVARGQGVCHTREKSFMRTAQRTCPDCGKPALMKSKFNENEWYCNAKNEGCGAKFPLSDERITSQQVGTVHDPQLVWDGINRARKIANKRAKADAVKRIGMLSEKFTVDLEDFITYSAEDLKPRQSVDEDEGLTTETPIHVDTRRVDGTPVKASTETWIDTSILWLSDLCPSLNIEFADGYKLLDPDALGWASLASTYKTRGALESALRAVAPKKPTIYGSPDPKAQPPTPAEPKHTGVRFTVEGDAIVRTPIIDPPARTVTHPPLDLITKTRQMIIDKAIPVELLEITRPNKRYRTRDHEAWDILVGYDYSEDDTLHGRYGYLIFEDMLDIFKQYEIFAGWNGESFIFPPEHRPVVQIVKRDGVQKVGKIIAKNIVVYEANQPLPKPDPTSGIYQPPKRNVYTG